MPESKSGALPTWLYPYEKKEGKFNLATYKIVNIYDFYIILVINNHLVLAVGFEPIVLQL